MFNKMFMASLFLMAALTSACTKSSSGNEGGSGSTAPQGASGQNWPAYAEQELSGKVFGQDWKALSAVARPSIGNAAEMTVEIYSEKLADACASQTFSQKPYASVVIPSQYAEQEYVADMTNLGAGQSGNPLVFTSLEGNSKNVMADKTKLQILAINSSGFQMSLYASGQEADGALSEINGKISVIDCARAIDFKEWEALAGWYSLKSFDGAAQDGRTSTIEIDPDSFFDRATQKWVPTAVFPLYESVSTNFDMKYDFGPMKNLGQTTMVKNQNDTVYTYSYSGPIYADGYDVTLNLEMTVKKTANTLEVQYTLEVPSHIKKTTHSFILQK